MLTTKENIWGSFLDFIKKRISKTEFQNWFKPIKLIEEKRTKLSL